MKEFKTVEPFIEPSNNILKKLGISLKEFEVVSEMNPVDRAFLCGMIRKHRPHKIVEVGVAEGGTTAIILECIQELKLDCEMYSVDAVEDLYYDKTKKVGYILDELREKGADLGNCKHTLITGKILPEVVDEIGSEIDFLILDTIHTMPGENLDFLAAFPYLTKDAVVVMHDVLLSQRPEYVESIATNVLFASVTADKYLNIQSLSEDINIAAFQLNNDTQKYLLDVAAGLMLPWEYYPQEEYVEAYGIAISKLGPQFLALYQYAARNKLQKVREAAEDWVNNFDWSTYRHVLLYGTGNRGKMFLQLCQAFGVEIEAFVVSDGWVSEGNTEGIPIYEYSSIPFPKEDCLIIRTAMSEEVAQNLKHSDYQVLNLAEELWGSIYLWSKYQDVH